MSKKYVLYNPHAGNGKCKAEVDALCARYVNAECCDVTDIKDIPEFFAKLEAEEDILQAPPFLLFFLDFFIILGSDKDKLLAF